jgi:pre-rRNA-processing protein TSR2
MSTSISTTASSTPVQSPSILLFARGVYALFHLWPALRLAVSEDWVDDAQAKRIWFISTIVDEFEEKDIRSNHTQSQNAPRSTDSTQVTASSASSSTTPSNSSKDRAIIPPPPGLDLDSLSDLLFDIITDEFSMDLSDDSETAIARSLLLLWSAACHLDLVPIETIEAQYAKTSKSKVVASAGPEQGTVGEDGEDWSSDSEDGDGMEGLDSIVEGTGGMELDGETAPRLIQRRPEPVIDEDGFEMVQSKKGGGKKK